MRLKDIKPLFPNAINTGKDIITPLMPIYCKVFHIDSHDTHDGGFRFQGVVISSNPNADEDELFVLTQMPLSVLTQAKNYQLIINDGFIVWTVWL